MSLFSCIFFLNNKVPLYAKKVKFCPTDVEMLAFIMYGKGEVDDFYDH